MYLSIRNGSSKQRLQCIPMYRVVVTRWPSVGVGQFIGITLPSLYNLIEHNNIIVIWWWLPQDNIHNTRLVKQWNSDYVSRISDERFNTVCPFMMILRCLLIAVNGLNAFCYDPFFDEICIKSTTSIVYQVLQTPHNVVIFSVHLHNFHVSFSFKFHAITLYIRNVYYYYVCVWNSLSLVGNWLIHLDKTF